MQKQAIVHKTFESNTKNFEEILVIARHNIFQNHQAWHGINPDCTWILKAVADHGQYILRGCAETNPMFKQIIPYVLFIHEQNVFVMQRKNNASETRLANKFSIGIGGHMQKEDTDLHNIFTWAHREFHEEVQYSNPDTLELVGILNDDSNEVGKVHLGIIMIMHATSADIAIKSEHKTGKLLDKKACLKLFDQMEPWSQICLKFLIEQKYLL